MSLIKFVKSDNTNKAMECLQGSPNLLERDETDGRTVFHYKPGKSFYSVYSII